MPKYRGVLLVLLVLAAQFSIAQSRFASLTDALSKSSSLAGKSGPSSVNWIENGARYSFKGEGNTIISYDPATKQETLIFDPSKEKFPATGQPFVYSSFKWSADYQFIVFVTNTTKVWRNSGNSDYYLYSVKDKTLRLVAEQAYTAQLSPDGKKLGYEKGGNLYVLDLGTRAQAQLTSDAKPFFYNGRFGWAYEEEFGLVQGWEWSPDSKSIAYWQSDERKVPIFRYTNYEGFKEDFREIPYPRVGDPNPSVRIGVVNLQSRKTRWMNVDCGEGYIPRIYWTASPADLAIVHLNRKQNHMQLFFADINSGNARKILEEKNDNWVEIFSFGAGIMHFFYFPADTKEFFWTSEADGYSHVYRYNYQGKLINQVTSGKWQVIKVLKMDDARKRIYYLSTETSPLERHLYAIGFDGSNKKKLTTATGNHDVNFGGRYYIDTYSSTTLPKQVDLCDAEGKVISKLQDNQAVKGFLASHMYSIPQLEQFTTSDGQKIDISIIKPFDFDANKKYPLLLDVYGGPAHQSVFNSFDTNIWHQYLAQLGYVVVKVNNRGGSGYGAAFKKIVYGNLGHWECHDFAETVKYMVSKSWIDEKRVGIKGHSYGGFTAAYSTLNYPDMYKVALVGAPVADWRIYDAIYTERFMGVLPENKANYDKAAVLSYTKKLKGKMLIVHSTFDDNVHIRNTMQLLKSFIDNGIDVDQRIYQGGGHGVTYSTASYQLLMKQYTDYLEKHLK